MRVICVVVLASLTACSPARTDTAHAASTTSAGSQPPTTNPGPVLPEGARVCTGGKSPGPGPAVDWSVDGEVGNEWELSASPGRSLTVRATVRPNARVTDVAFVMAPADGPFPSDDAVVVGTAGAWEPGAHEVRIRWDGRDRSGHRLAAGRYRLFGQMSTSSYRPVTCLDGSGAGVELSGGGEADGLGVLVVPR